MKRKTIKRSGQRWFVYILKCRDESLYTGITLDLARRLKQHNAGTASKYTRSRLPVKLVYREVQIGRSIATKRELAIKSLSRREKLKLVHQWKDRNDGQRFGEQGR